MIALIEKSGSKALYIESLHSLQQLGMPFFISHTVVVQHQILNLHSQLLASIMSSVDIKCIKYNASVATPLKKLKKQRLYLKKSNSSSFKVFLFLFFSRLSYLPPVNSAPNCVTELYATFKSLS